jgi:FtsP/CotA-like multicopper oxidase with cupredoxin domain
MKTALAGACALCVFSAAALAQMQMPGHEGHEGHGAGAPMAMEHGVMQMPPAAGWRDPNRPISPPPPLTGRQMGQVDTIHVPPLGYELDGRVKVFTLIAQPIEQQLTTGQPMDERIIPELNRFTGMTHGHPFAKKVRLWGYNGTSPGPTIECTEGDTIRVILKNELPEPTSIHWHGMEVPNAQDGAGGHTEAATPPGGTHTYQFTLYQTGTFLYHSGFNMMKQDHFGLQGFVVVHPRAGYRHKIDRDIAIMLQEWAFLPGNLYPHLVTMDFNWFVFNGRSAPDIATITIKQGERVRLRWGNMSMDSHPIHIHGYSWKVVGTEGGPIPEAGQWPGATINVPPGTTRDVEFVAWNPGLWRLHCHKLHHIINAHADVPMGLMGHGGMFTLVHVVPTDPNAEWRHPSQGGGE